MVSNQLVESQDINNQFWFRSILTRNCKKELIRRLGLTTSQASPEEAGLVGLRILGQRGKEHPTGGRLMTVALFPRDRLKLGYSSGRRKA